MGPNGPAETIGKMSPNIGNQAKALTAVIVL